MAHTDANLEAPVSVVKHLYSLMRDVRSDWADWALIDDDDGDAGDGVEKAWDIEFLSFERKTKKISMSEQDVLIVIIFGVVVIVSN